MKLNVNTILVIPAMIASHAIAICPGFNFAIGNQINEGGGFSRWNVYDDSCNVVDGLTTTENPCTQPSGIFSCSPPPVIFTGYKSSVTGLQFACRTDPNSGVCGNDVISVCCRNDGN